MKARKRRSLPRVTWHNESERVTVSGLSYADARHLFTLASLSAHNCYSRARDKLQEAEATGNAEAIERRREALADCKRDLWLLQTLDSEIVDRMQETFPQRHSRPLKDAIRERVKKLQDARAFDDALNDMFAEMESNPSARR